MIAALLLACAAFGTGAHIEASVDSAQIGEPFEITFVIEHETGATLKLPHPSTLPPDVALIADLGVQREIDPANPGVTTTRARWRIMALLGSVIEFQAYDIPVEGSGGNQILRVSGTKVTVAHALKEGEDAPRPARGFRDAPHVATAATKLTWIALGIVGLAAGFVAFRIARRRKKPTTPPAPSVAERLSQLEQQLGAEPERVRDHVFALTGLLRQALDAHAGENRAALSDEDWARATRTDTRVPATSREIVAKLLADAERVKYAGETPSLLGVRDSLAQADAALAALSATERTAA